MVGQRRTHVAAVTAEAANRAFRLVGPLGRSSLALQAPTPADIQTFNIWLRYYRRSRAGGSAMRSTSGPPCPF